MMMPHCATSTHHTNKFPPDGSAKESRIRNVVHGEKETTF